MKFIPDPNCIMPHIAGEKKWCKCVFWPEAPVGMEYFSPPKGFLPEPHGYQSPCPECGNRPQVRKEQ